MAYILIIGVMVLSWIVQARFNSKFKKYAQIPNSSGMSGAEVARKMLTDNGITNVQVVLGEGRLTDHYNPANHTVNLSSEVYNERSIAAMAVAAHECGHAVQHATAYSWLKMRSALVPVVSGVSRVLPWILIGGILTITVFPALLAAGVLLFAITTLFSFITLPVEFDASKRALAWLDSNHIAIGEEHGMAKDALNAAAKTYVIAAISSLATLLYYAMILIGRRD